MLNLPDRVQAAYSRLRAEAEARRRAESIRLFGHPGASIAGVTYPTIGDAVRAALERDTCAPDPLEHGTL